MREMALFTQTIVVVVNAHASAKAAKVIADIEHKMITATSNGDLTK